MKAEPEKSLKAVSTSIYLSYGMPYPVVTFEDGSVWRRTGEGWVLSWQPEPKPAEATPLQPKFSPDAFGMTFERLRRTDGKLEIIGGSPGLTIHCEADIKRIQELEEELAAHKRALQHEKDFSGKIRGQLNGWKEAANIRSSVKIWSPDDLGKRIAELEAELKAWQEAASVDLVENPDDPPPPCQTPEQLVERLRILYRWATRAEKDASELRKPISAIIDVITKIPPF